MTEEVTGEFVWNGLRLIVAHDPHRGAEQTTRRRERINALLAQGETWAETLDGQDAGVKKKGRKLSESGAKARLYRAVSEAHLSRIIKVDQSEVLRALNVKEPAIPQQLALL